MTVYSCKVVNQAHKNGLFLGNLLRPSSLAESNTQNKEKKSNREHE